MVGVLPWLQNADLSLAWGRNSSSQMAGEPPASSSRTTARPHCSLLSPSGLPSPSSRAPFSLPLFSLFPHSYPTPCRARLPSCSELRPPSLQIHRLSATSHRIRRDSASPCRPRHRRPLQCRLRFRLSSMPLLAIMEGVSSHGREMEVFGLQPRRQDGRGAAAAARWRRCGGGSDGARMAWLGHG